MKIRDLQVKIRSYLMTGDINGVILLICGCAFAHLLFSAIAFQLAYNGFVPPLIRLINILIFFLIFGLSGVVQIHRREAPGFLPNRSIRGVFAVLSGVLVLGLSWGIGILVLFQGIQEYIK
ncbi:MAG: hypothetical protein KIS80_05460 [Anaerolineales bacterium]|nr:hypothetical protein [Anaerolineales bacterium]